MKQFNKTARRAAYFLLFFFLAAPVCALAEMRSSSYVIYENVLHQFSGPVISNVAHSVLGNSATVTWNTDVLADSFAAYDTTNPFTSSREQGYGAKIFTSHSVTLAGLSYSTTYYYRPKSTRINGGVTIDPIVRSFTTGAAPATDPPAPAPPAGGGGLLIIDKTDKVAPTISEVAVINITADSAEIRWKTDENSTSFVEYGEGAGFGSTYGQWSSTTDHAVIIEKLKSNTSYYFRPLSSDSWGNVGRGEAGQFKTPVSAPGEEEEIAPPGELIPDEEQSVINEATRQAMEFLSRLFPEVSLNQIGAGRLFSIGSLREFAGFMPSPILSGEPRVEAQATQATIFWTTDIEASSQVAIAPVDEYRPGASEPYRQVVGNSEVMTRNHEVTVYGLTPDTEYHFQLRSRTNLGPTARSRDFTFKTSIEELTITSFFPQIVDDQTAVFKWVTNKEADSTVRFAPYQNNVVAIDQAKTVIDNARTIIHEIKIAEFQPGTFYDVELTSMDENGNLASRRLERFATAKDDLPPEISHIKADSTVFLDRSEKIQTIISWLTNEPATSKVYYQEGVQSVDIEAAESTILNTNYTKEHIMVITKFKPGLVYSFRVESIDSGGNITLSKVHTFMTAKRKESIIQIIIRILEQTFGWTKKLM